MIVQHLHSIIETFIQFFRPKSDWINGTTWVLSSFHLSSDIVSFRKDNHIAMKLLMATKKKRITKKSNSKFIYGIRELFKTCFDISILLLQKKKK